MQILKMRIILLLIIMMKISSCNSKKTLESKTDLNKGKIEFNKTKKIDLPNTKDVIVLRTDFSDDQKWHQICDLITKSGIEKGFRPYVEFLSDKKFENLEKERLLNRNKDYQHLFIFLIDSITIKNNENPILCIDLYDYLGKYFRTIPKEMWVVENNLSISNVDFEEFYDSTDTNGIYRGFE